MTEMASFKTDNDFPVLKIKSFKFNKGIFSF